jgi:hypothetical protein
MTWVVGDLSKVLVMYTSLLGYVRDLGLVASLRMRSFLNFSNIGNPGQVLTGSFSTGC